MDEQLRVLILEDVALDAELMQYELRKGGIAFTARRAASETEFLKELQEFAPHIVLSDYALPTFDGVSALAAVLQRCPGVPFIFVSGNIGEDEALELVKSGATDYVLKSRLSRLGPAVRRALQEGEERRQRQQADEALRRKSKDLAALYEASRIFLDLTDETTTLETLCRLTVKDFGLKMAWVGLVVRGSFDVHPAWSYGFEEGYLNTVKVTWDDSPSGRGPTGAAIRLARAVAMNHIETDPAFAPWRAAAVERGYRSAAALPLCYGDDVLGALNVYSEAPEYFTDDRLQVLQSFANQGAVALAKARLYAQVQYNAAELEQKVTERTQQLQEINSELESFSYSISHDLRAPLWAMKGFAQALLEDCSGQLNAEGREHAERIIAAAQRLDRMVQDILAYSRLSRAELTMEPVGLESAVGEALEQCETELRDRKAQVTVAKPLPLVQGHRATLVQLVGNLLTNAAKFVKLGVQPSIRVWAEARQEWVRLWVEDNGVGIAPKNQDRIFRLFERLHPADEYPGTGIGLAIVRRAVVRMGGRAGVESEVGKGSRFWVELKKA